MDEAKINAIVDARLAELLGGDHFIFSKLIQIIDGRNIQLGRTTGTKIGTAIDQKLGFFGKTPVVQPAAPTSTATIIALLQALGLSA